METQLSHEQVLRIWLITHGKSLHWLAEELNTSVQNLLHHLHKPSRLAFPPKYAYKIEELTNGEINGMDLMLNRIPPTGSPATETTQDTEIVTTAP